MDEFAVSMHTPFCSIHAHARPVSMHTPENQAAIKEWLEQGVPWPVKAKVHATRTKTMVATFFDSLVPKGTTVNSVYIVKVLQEFLRQLRKNRLNFQSKE
jgi:hypothetical protein